MFSWEAAPFPDEALVPFLVVADRGRDRQVVLGYELEADVCPKYAADEQACTIYEDRPTVCRAFPLLISTGENGLEVAASSLCGARIPLDGLGEARDRGEGREARLARAYPDAFAPALAVPAIVEHLLERVAFLAQADRVDPATGLDPEEAGTFGNQPPVGFHELLDELGTSGVDQLEASAERITDEIRERWSPSAPP